MKMKLLFILILSLAELVFSQAKRMRNDGLSATISSSTTGKENLDLTVFGRTFLWDNAAAQKLPPVLPHLEANYGLTDYLDVSAGLNVLTYVFSPGYFYGRMKLTTPDNKSLRFLGFALTAEAKKSLLHYFPSNGFRTKTEGFGPEGFILGNDNLITSYTFTFSSDVELIRISSYLPFKLYGNLGYTGEYGSYINDDNAAIIKASKNRLKINSQNFALMPVALGIELKTYSTDFFTEIEAQPFISQVMRKIDADINGEPDAEWKRFTVIGKTFDVNIFETPIYVNSGAKLKYPNGFELQGGMSWLLSTDRGATLGPCDRFTNPCKEGATDGFSPFYPQWKVFWQMKFPFHFTQPSSELYRSFILKRYQDKRKTVNLEATLAAPTEQAQDLDANERRRRLEERRKEADGKAVDLN